MHHGHFLWRDCRSSNPEKAMAFYTALFGWTVEPQDMGPMGVYNQVSNNGEGFGGITPILGEGVPSHWISYIESTDVDATVAKASALGGTVLMAAHDIPEVGRTALIQDPQGAHSMPFMPFPQDVELPPHGNAIAPHGGVAWNELMSTDAAGSVAFYTGLYGYGHQAMPMPGDVEGEYHVLTYEETMEAGVMQAPAGMPMSAWTIYFEVSDIDAAHKRVAELGGTNVMEIMHVPTIGRLGMQQDPTGAHFAIMQSEPMPS